VVDLGWFCSWGVVGAYWGLGGTLIGIGVVFGCVWVTGKGRDGWARSGRLGVRGLLGFRIGMLLLKKYKKVAHNARSILHRVQRIKTNEICLIQSTATANCRSSSKRTKETMCNQL
jgi:hypothetical protein